MQAHHCLKSFLSKTLSKANFDCVVSQSSNSATTVLKSMCAAARDTASESCMPTVS